MRLELNETKVTQNSNLKHIFYVNFWAVKTKKQACDVHKIYGAFAMTSYKIGGETSVKDEPGFNALLAGAYRAKIRPVCLCKTPPVEMYVANFDEKFFIKRMPNSGSEHHFSCESFDPPPELSGLGQVQGTAIKENTEDGTTVLRFDFSLTKLTGRKPPEKQDAKGASVKSEGSKLTLTSALHYLWEEAQFNRWAPAMSGKRGWFVIRKYLLQAAQSKRVKGVALPSLLFIPENFYLEKKDEITRRRMAQMINATNNGPKGQRRLMLFIGELKEIECSRYSHQLVLKHLPDFHFLMSEDMHKRLTKRYELELGMRKAAEDTHLICVGTFSLSSSGIATLEEAALMVVNENWLPIESIYEKHLIDSLVASGRKFTKGLRYNVSHDRPVACAVATDTSPTPTAMYIVPSADKTYRAHLNELIRVSAFDSWVWHVANANMPQLPTQVLELQSQGNP